MNNSADIAVVGLAVMGENLALNLESRGFVVAVFNRTSDKTDLFLSEKGEAKKFIPAHTLSEMILSLKKPRKIILMIKAGRPVDEMLNQLLPLLEKGDIVIDGGNSLYTDTEVRLARLKQAGLRYIGCGISGGEEGALKGPSLMPGGDPDAWPEVKTILDSIAARAPDGKTCCDWMGPGGAGHFVKMVHNGIEYGYMQILSEIYQIMRDVFRLDAFTIGELFSTWNKGALGSYLVEITAEVLSVKDKDGLPLVDKIADSAGQKGTGRWTVEAALEAGVPLGVLTEAVFFRALSADRTLRKVCKKAEPSQRKQLPLEIKDWIKNLEEALLLGQIIAFGQGFSLLSSKSKTSGWNVPLAKIAETWRGGCIIRSNLLNKIRDAFIENPETPSLLATKQFAPLIQETENALKAVTVLAIENDIPIPSLSSAISFLSALRGGKTGINLLQAQRDFFGAHTFERTDHPVGVFFHENWTSLS